ncbi:hypothetical protein, partial [Methylomonas sp. MgM2]
MHKIKHFKKKKLSTVIVSLLTPGLVSAAQINWTDTTGFWDVASNWSSDPSLPGSLDDVVLNVVGTQTVTVRSTGGPFVINSVGTDNGDETLFINSGSLTLNGNSSANNATGASVVGRFSQSGGLLNGPGKLTITDHANFTGGTHSGSGTTTLQGTTTISSGAI